MRKLFDVVLLEDKERSSDLKSVWIGMCQTLVPIVRYDESGGFTGFFIGTLPPVEGYDKHSTLRAVELQVIQHFTSLRTVFSEIEFDKIMVGI